MLSPAETFSSPLHVTWLWSSMMMMLAMTLATPLRPPEWANRCGCAGSRGSCSHDPAAPTPDNGLGGCGECEPHSDATPTPNADVVMSDACSSSVEMSPEAALQGLVGAAPNESGLVLMITIAFMTCGQTILRHAASHRLAAGRRADRGVVVPIIALHASCF